MHRPRFFCTTGDNDSATTRSNDTGFRVDLSGQYAGLSICLQPDPANPDEDIVDIRHTGPIEAAHQGKNGTVLRFVLGAPVR